MLDRVAPFSDISQPLRVRFETGHASAGDYQRRQGDARRAFSAPAAYRGRMGPCASVHLGRFGDGIKLVAGCD